MGAQAPGNILFSVQLTVSYAPDRIEHCRGGRGHPVPGFVRVFSPSWPEAETHRLGAVHTHLLFRCAQTADAHAILGNGRLCILSNRQPRSDAHAPRRHRHRVYPMSSSIFTQRRRVPPAHSRDVRISLTGIDQEHLWTRRPLAVAVLDDTYYGVDDCARDALGRRARHACPIVP